MSYRNYVNMAAKILCPILKNFRFSCIVPKYNSYTSPSACFSIGPQKGFQYKELQGDLFSCQETDALAHCISMDIAMGKGIAVLFKKKFGGVQELKNQGKKVGEVAVLKRESRFVYYLITKERYFHKPTYETLTNSLQAMKKHSVDNNVKCISMPKIGCGLDKLQWDKVSAILKEVFGDTDVSIKVYSI